MTHLINSPNKDYFLNLNKIDNAFLKTIHSNGIDMRAIEKVEIKTFVGDKVYLTVMEIEK
jgi:hypothetical protein